MEEEDDEGLSAGRRRGAARARPGKRHAARWRAVVWALLAALTSCATDPAPPLSLAPGKGDLAAEVQAIVAGLGPDVRVALWLSPPGGEPLFEQDADAPMPVASAIKAAYLVELYAAFPAALGEPLPGASAILDDAQHAAVAHFRPEQRQRARSALATSSVQRLGEAMVRGNGVDNATYNLAANLVTAHFGGPAAFEERLQTRDPSWRGLRVRRYMLASRTANGDNEATARSLASVHGMLARGSVPGVDARAVAAARAVLARPADASLALRFGKGGSLDSDPVTRVDAGWRDGPSGTAVFVVMLAQGGVPAAERAAAGQRLAAGVRRIVTILLDAVR